LDSKNVPFWGIFILLHATKLSSRRKGLSSQINIILSPRNFSSEAEKISGAGTNNEWFLDSDKNSEKLKNPPSAGFF